MRSHCHAHCTKQSRATIPPAAVRASLNGLAPEYVEVVDLGRRQGSRRRRSRRFHPSDRQRPSGRRALMSDNPKPARYASWTTGKLPLPELAEMKGRGDKIVMVTAYDAPSGAARRCRRRRPDPGRRLVGDGRPRPGVHGAGDARRDAVHDAVPCARREAAARDRRPAVRLVRGLGRAGRARTRCAS